MQTPSLGSARLALLVRWSIVIALWALLISMATGQSGVSNYRELLRNEEELLSVTNGLRLENQLLGERIERLKSSREAQLRYLKEDFGYIEEGEVVYHFSGKHRPSIPAKPAPSPKPQSANNEARTQKRI
jgi:cell division protein FtsB